MACYVNLMFFLHHMMKTYNQLVTWKARHGWALLLEVPLVCVVSQGGCVFFYLAIDFFHLVSTRKKKPKIKLSLWPTINWSITTSNFKQ